MQDFAVSAGIWTVNNTWDKLFVAFDLWPFEQNSLLNLIYGRRVSTPYRDLLITVALLWSQSALVWEVKWGVT